MFAAASKAKYDATESYKEAKALSDADATDEELANNTATALQIKEDEEEKY